MSVLKNTNHLFPNKGWRLDSLKPLNLFANFVFRTREAKIIFSESLFFYSPSWSLETIIFSSAWYLSCSFWIIYESLSFQLNCFSFSVTINVRILFFTSLCWSEQLIQATILIVCSLLSSIELLGTFSAVKTSSLNERKHCRIKTEAEKISTRCFKVQAQPLCVEQR